MMAGVTQLSFPPTLAPPALVPLHRAGGRRRAHPHRRRRAEAEGRAGAGRRRRRRLAAAAAAVPRDGPSPGHIVVQRARPD